MDYGGSETRTLWGGPWLVRTFPKHCCVLCCRSSGHLVFDGESHAVLDCVSPSKARARPEALPILALTPPFGPLSGLDRPRRRLPPVRGLRMPLLGEREHHPGHPLRPRGQVCVGFTCVSVGFTCISVGRVNNRRVQVVWRLLPEEPPPDALPGYYCMHLVTVSEASAPLVTRPPFQIRQNEHRVRSL